MLLKHKSRGLGFFFVVLFFVGFFRVFFESLVFFLVLLVAGGKKPTQAIKCYHTFFPVHSDQNIHVSNRTM